jgi:hypothetical protein
MEWVTLLAYLDRFQHHDVMVAFLAEVDWIYVALRGRLAVQDNAHEPDWLVLRIGQDGEVVLSKDLLGFADVYGEVLYLSMGPLAIKIKPSPPSCAGELSPTAQAEPS